MEKGKWGGRQIVSCVHLGASRHCHSNRWQGRSAPVLGRSNIRERITVETLQRTWQTGFCCARGQAHSSGGVKTRPVHHWVALATPSPELAGAVSFVLIRVNSWLPI